MRWFEIDYYREGIKLNSVDSQYFKTDVNKVENTLVTLFLVTKAAEKFSSDICSDVEIERCCQTRDKIKIANIKQLLSIVGSMKRNTILLQSPWNYKSFSSKRQKIYFEYLSVMCNV